MVQHRLPGLFACPSELSPLHSSKLQTDLLGGDDTRSGQRHIGRLPGKGGVGRQGGIIQHKL